MEAMNMFAIFLMFIATSNCMPANDFQALEEEFLALLAEKRLSYSHKELDHILDFQCDKGNWVNHIACVHDNHDRKWSVDCSSHGLGEEYTENTSDYINDENELMEYQCPNNGFIKGLYSMHMHERGDLRWKVTCASVQGKCPTNCEYSEPNGWGDNVDFTVPVQMGLRGMVSARSVNEEDPRYFWESCKYIDCSTDGG